MKQSQIIEYIFLILSGIFYLVFLSAFSGQHVKQLIITTVFIGFYVIWAIIHHARDQSLHLKVVLEYLIIGAVVFFLLRSLII